MEILDSNNKKHKYQIYQDFLGLMSTEHRERWISNFNIFRSASQKPIELRLQNFKAFSDEQVIPIKPITLVYGANSAGKSTVLQSLLLIKQSFGRYSSLPFEDEPPTDYSLIYDGNIINLGSFCNVVHNKICSNDIAISVKYNKLNYFKHIFSNTKTDIDNNKERNSNFYTTVKYFDSGELLFDYSTERTLFNQEHANLQKIIATITENKSVIINNAQRELINRDKHDEAVLCFLKNVQNLLSDLPQITCENIYIFENLYALIDNDTITKPVDLNFEPTGEPHHIFRDFIKLSGKIDYLGSLRHFPERYYIRDTNLPDTIGYKGEHLAQKLAENSELVLLINQWFDRLSIPYRLSIKVINDPDITVYTMVLEDIRNGIKVGPLDVGFGISQVMPVVLQTASSENRLILIEQPEIHLHPKLQAEIADLFISSSKGPNSNTFMLETHSEHLLLRIMRRMRETATSKLERPEYALTPEDVSVLYVESIEGRSIVREMPLNEYGELVVPWPGGFFEEGLREMF